MNILAISASPRLHGNSDLLCDQFLKGAAEVGHTVEKIRLEERDIAPCAACSVCQSDGNCVKKDDMAEILEKVIHADTIVLATPIYFYSMSASLKQSSQRASPENRHNKKSPQIAAQKRIETKINQIQRLNHL